MVRLVIMIHVVGGVSYVGCGCSTNVVSMKLHRDSARELSKCIAKPQGCFIALNLWALTTTTDNKMACLDTSSSVNTMILFYLSV